MIKYGILHIRSAEVIPMLDDPNKDMDLSGYGDTLFSALRELGKDNWQMVAVEEMPHSRSTVYWFSKTEPDKEEPEFLTKDNVRKLIIDSLSARTE